MHVQFLLGRAGSGKTTRCLAGIREELERSPEGRPLLLIAPKQATFQLERMLLESGGVQGWTRLQILSFDRLASQILSQGSPVQLLAEEGRIMVLRGLLRRHRDELSLFRSAARLTGFAREVSTMLREFQQQRAGPDRLQATAQRLGDGSSLALKLADLALLLRKYQEWLRERGLHDPDSLVELAAEALQRPGTRFDPQGLWLDGFAEMTPQEIDLLQAAAQRTHHVTAAFCVEPESAPDVPWSSPWSVVQQTYRRIRQAFAALPGATVETVVLGGPGQPGRFQASPALARLERHWIHPTAAPPPAPDETQPPLRCVACTDAEEEAEVAAREIRRQVRQGARYREIAVLVRSLEHHHAALERVFLRYEIPFFLDRRSPLSHHPLAELVRGTLRLAALGWKHEDWFGILKTGLHPLPEALVDSLENQALAGGWEAEFWRRAPGDSPPPELGTNTGAVAELVLTFERFIDGIGEEPDATILGRALRRLWTELGTHEALEAWIESEGELASGGTFLHRTAREEILGWLENVERGFAHDAIPLAEWLPILDAGLASLTAGAIPPAQDQVLIGAIDRSRQPDLRTAILIGWNEGLFPAPAPTGGLLTDSERERLTSLPDAVIGERLRLIGHERYFGYIAVTRAREQLLVTWSGRDAAGRPLLPSPFVRQLSSLFPSLTHELADAEAPAPDSTPERLAARVEHRCELLPWLLARPDTTPLDGLAGDALRRAWLRRYREGPGPDQLHPTVAQRLLGRPISVSVSGLESFAACPFQFFVRHTLRAEEREQFEVDPRHLGSLAHDILARFHDSILADDLEWRDVSAIAARERLECAATASLADPHHAVFQSTPETRWRTESLVRQLAELVAILVSWATRCAFSPRFAELAFGTVEQPAWKLTTHDGLALSVRGKVDRLDTWVDPQGVTHFLVLDYKLSPPRLADDLVAAGIDLQLAAYALALPSRFPWRRHLGPEPDPDETTDSATTLTAPSRAGRSETAGPASASPPIPAGMFYIPLRARAARRPTRALDPEQAREERWEAFKHRGRFDADRVDQLETDGTSPGLGQFAISRTQSGALRKGGEGRPSEEFQRLLDLALHAIRDAGDRIAHGHAEVSPYKKGRQSACDRCSLRPVCRFDPWTQSFRRIPALATSE
ncbi:MAG: PD-(D/E)XK nuclease family protein [Verrucomicrobiales bacterium]|nr:PD-(D/E)XK nuclease family protein [Verrucomicrobiales bacterium]